MRINRKYDIFMQRRLVQNFTFILEWGQGTCSLMKHTQRWAYSQNFSLHAAYSALRHFFIPHTVTYSIISYTSFSTLHGGLSAHVSAFPFQFDFLIYSLYIYLPICERQFQLNYFNITYYNAITV